MKQVLITIKNVLIIVVVIAIVVLVYQYSSKQKTTVEKPAQELDTTNWKTYTNEEYGFQFQYPEKTSVENVEDGDRFYIKVKLEPETSKLNTEKEFLLIVERGLTDGTSVHACRLAMSDLKEGRSSISYYNGIKFIVTNNNPAPWADALGYSTEYVTEKDGVCFFGELQVTWSLKDGDTVNSNDQLENKIGQDIISTFKFTK